MAANHKVATSDFFARHPVFTLDDAAEALQPPRGRAGAVSRLKHHLKQGRLQRVAREVYAVVPPGERAAGFQPDVFLVARAVRPGGVFSHHSALELLGVAHSAWRQCTVFCNTRRPPLRLSRDRVHFLEHPAPLRSDGDVLLGTTTVEYKGEILCLTGPERTLVEGFRRLDLVGGLDEFINPASDFPGLDLDALFAVLSRYDMAVLWAAVGWLLEACQHEYATPSEYLQRLEARRPRSPQYLVRRRRGGKLVKRWNLILPTELAPIGEHHGR